MLINGTLLKKADTLYINGEYDQIRWPQSGNNPKLIKIRHVAQETDIINE